MGNPAVAWTRALGCAVFACLPLAAGAQPAPGKFEAQVRQFVDEYLVAEPIFGDTLGSAKHDDRFPDLSVSGHAKTIAFLHSWRERFIDSSTPGDSIDIVADRRQLIDTIDAQLFEDQALTPLATDPQTYIEPLGDGIFLLLIRDSQSPDVRFENIAKRLALVPSIVDHAIANLTHPTRAATELAISQNRGLIGMYENDVPPAAKAASAQVQADVARALPAAIAALRKLQTHLEGPLLAQSNRSPRVGAATFDKLLNLATGTDEKRETLVAHAQANIAATRAQMLRISEPLDRQLFPGRAHPETGEARINAIVGEVFDKLAEQHAAPDKVLDSARADAAKIVEFLNSSKIVPLPVPDTLNVRQTPVFQAGFSGASFQSPGPFAPLAPSFYNVDPPSTTASAAAIESNLREYNEFGLQMLTIHEALPGHYVQFRYGAQNPSQARNIFGNGAYIEGWAVYAEGMMLDGGYGNGDQKLRLYQLRWRLREYTNAILDAEYHAGALEKPQAIQMMLEQAFQTQSEAENKWRRLQLSHDQLSTYFAGLEAIQTAKADSKLSTPEFNRRVLLMGAVEPRFIEPLLKNTDTSPAKK